MTKEQIAFWILILGIPAALSAVCLWMLWDWLKLIEKRHKLHEEMYGRIDDQT